jgi:hypothetical protein
MLMRGNALVLKKHLSKMPREPALRNTCHGPRTSLQQRAFHPTDHVQQDIHPTENPPTLSMLDESCVRIFVKSAQSTASKLVALASQEMCGNVLSVELGLMMSIKPSAM